MKFLALLPVLAALVYGQQQGPEQLARDAIAKQQAGDLAGAVEEYRAFLKLHPEVAAIHSNLGAALAGLGHYGEAVPEYKEARRLSPSLPGVALNLALAYYKMGQIGNTAQELVKAYSADPKEMQAKMLLADCYLRMGRNKDVIRLLKPIENANQSSLAITYMLGTALIRDHQIAGGQMLVDKILRNGDSAPAHLMLGSAKFEAHDFAGARDEFEKAVTLDPKLPEVHGLYAQALEATGDPDHAMKEFQEELKNNPYDYKSNLQIGVLLSEDQKFDDAMQYFRRALNARPGDVAVSYQIATIHLAENKTLDAEGELESIVKRAPQFTAAHVSLATAYYRLKRTADGNRERAIVQRLTAEAQARQPGVKAQ